MTLTPGRMIVALWLVAIAGFACGSLSPKPCSATDVEGAAHALTCRDRIAKECPAGEPLEGCKAYQECHSYGVERCK